MEIELKQIKPTVLKLFKNGKATGKEYITNDSNEFLDFNFKDKLLDIPCTAIAEGICLQFHFIEASIPGWVNIITLKRKKNNLIIQYFATLSSDKEGYRNNLNDYVLMRKISAMAKKEGMKPDYITEDYVNNFIYMISDLSGTLRQKIVKGTTLLSTIRKKAEREMIADIKKGILVSKLKDVPFKGYLKILD